MVAEEARFLVGGVRGSQGGRGVGDAGEIDRLATVVFLAPVARRTDNAEWSLSRSTRGWWR